MEIKMKPMPFSQSELQRRFHYDRDTGLFTWLINPMNGSPVGSVAGWINAGGYRAIEIGGVAYSAHRLAWFYCYGLEPTRHIDHINGIRDDNRIENLRECSRGENAQNTKVRSDNKAGIKGVRMQKGRWLASISIQGHRKHIGSFDTAEAASEAYQRAKAELHDFQPTPR